MSFMAYQADVDLTDEARSAACFNAIKNQLEKMSDRDLMHVNLDIVSLAATVIGAAPRIRAFRAEASELPRFDASCMDAIEDRAYALLYAHRRHQITIQPDGNLNALNLEAVQTRDRFRAEVQSLCLNGVLDSGILREYSGHLGYRPVAGDLFLLAGIFRNHWAALEKHTVRTTDELDRAEALASRMLRLFGLRQHTDADVAEWQRMRQRAYTMVVREYGEARAAIVFLRRGERDADSIAPSLFAGRARRKRAEPLEPSPDPIPAPV